MCRGVRRGVRGGQGQGRAWWGAAGLSVPPPHVLTVLGHGSLAVVAARELDERLARRLLALVEHEVHAW